MLKATEYIQNKVDERNLYVPNVAVVLESGISKITDNMVIQLDIQYEDIPGLETTNTENHNGRYIIGEVGNHEVIAMDGRINYYELQEMDKITKHIRVLSELGCDTLITTDIVGRLNKNYEIGGIFTVRDHINLMGSNPLLDRNTRKVHFLNQNNIYDSSLINRVKEICKENHISHHSGVYVGMKGPVYETPAESKMLKNLGGDVVGMATIPESIEAHRCEMDVLSICIVTNPAQLDNDNDITRENIMNTVKHNKYDLKTILEQITDEVIKI